MYYFVRYYIETIWNTCIKDHSPIATSRHTHLVLGQLKNLKRNAHRVTLLFKGLDTKKKRKHSSLRYSDIH